MFFFGRPRHELPSQENERSAVVETTVGAPLLALLLHLDKDDCLTVMFSPPENAWEEGPTVARPAALTKGNEAARKRRDCRSQESMFTRVA